eukprot:1155968-Pelagomonas_calceolata.AAC.2
MGTHKGRQWELVTAVGRSSTRERKRVHEEMKEYMRPKKSARDRKHVHMGKMQEMAFRMQ